MVCPTYLMWAQYAHIIYIIHLFGRLVKSRSQVLYNYFTLFYHFKRHTAKMLRIFAENAAYFR